MEINFLIFVLLSRECQEDQTLHSLGVELGQLDGNIASNVVPEDKILFDIGVGLLHKEMDVCSEVFVAGDGLLVAREPEASHSRHDDPHISTQLTKYRLKIWPTHEIPMEHHHHTRPTSTRPTNFKILQPLTI